jgi:hypothetical protein
MMSIDGNGIPIRQLKGELIARARDHVARINDSTYKKSAIW